MNIQINKNTGEVTFDGSLQIGPHITEDEWVSFATAEKAKPFHIDEARHSYGFSIPVNDELEWDFLVSFDQGKMHGVGFGYAYKTPENEPPITRTAASEEKLLKKAMETKKMNEAFLAEQLGEPPYRYPWGTVTSWMNKATEPFSTIDVEYS